MLRETGYAKINLALHVRRRRADGYHEIETVFAFCQHGDIVQAEPARSHELMVDGPFAEAIAGEPDGNLAFRAALLGPPARYRLTKTLPVAAGLGGGSADAGAVLRMVEKLSGHVPSLAEQRRLGADVPACVRSETVRGEGVGDVMTSADAVTGTPVLLVNPRVPLSTAAVFKRWDGVDRGPLGDWRQGRNDLEQAARAVVPEVGEVLDWLDERAPFVRMSGSGASCFALFDSDAERDRVTKRVPASWWSLASSLR